MTGGLDDCLAVREILSAELDGRADGSEVARARHHMSTCRGCAEWLTAAESIQRLVRVRPAEYVPDLSSVVLERAHPPRPGRGEWVRYSLVVVALTQFVVALPHLFSLGSLHDSRHLGAMAVALSLGLLYTAHRPTRAYGILPIVSALAVTMVGAALADVIRGSTPLIGEAVHVLELIGFVLVWMLAGRPGLPRRRRFSRRRVLRSVDAHESASRRSVA
ncbi:MAG: zf-HC2 domain-containing protein [Actinobacteria bacterium]|nr:zf-HC2 domain-containing protein [Actinomycetota bacterium]